MTRLAVLALAFAAGCAPGPASPRPPGGTPAPASAFEGIWQFQYRVDECDGERHCVLTIGTTPTVAVRLAQSGSSFDGVVTIANRNIDVSGAIGANGTLELTGANRKATSTDYEIRITRLELRHVAGSLSGTFAYTITGPPNSSFWGHARRSGPIVGASRRGTIADSRSGFAGRWRGHVAVRDCTFTRWAACYPHEQDELHFFELALTQTGSRVEGTMNISGSATEVAVEGTASESMLQLQRFTGTQANSGTDVEITLRSWNASRDKLGRLKGTFSFEIRWIWRDPSTGVSSTDFRLVELIDVALLPT